MASTVSKNTYALLGNDPSLDSDREESPLRVAEPTGPRTGKRNPGTGERVVKSGRGADKPRGGGGGVAEGNESVLREPGVGQANLDKPTDARREAIHPRNRGARDDRRSRTGKRDTDKVVKQGWGGKEADKELEEERAGAQVAEDEEKNAENEEANKPTEPEVISYADFLAKREATKPSDLGVKEPRRALDDNANAKWGNATPLNARQEHDEYFAGKQGEKAPRQRSQNKKTFLDVDFTYQQPARESARGGGRGGRGGRGGGRGGGSRGPPRNGQQSQGPKVDEANFPSLKST